MPNKDTDKIMIRSYGMTSFLATSGLVCLFLSPNESIKKIHELSRSNFETISKALILLTEANINYEIIWVARNDNVKNFRSLVKMGTDYKAHAINA